MDDWDEQTEIESSSSPGTEEGVVDSGRPTGAGKVALKRAATLGTLGRRGSDRAEDDKRNITASLWSFISYLVS